MTAEELRKVSGGVIGHFTPKEMTVTAADLVVGANTQITVGMLVQILLMI